MLNRLTQALLAPILLAGGMALLLRDADLETGHLKEPAGPGVRLKVGSGMKARLETPATEPDQKHVLEDMLAGRPFVLVADGRAGRFVLSLEELHVAEGPQEQRWRRFPRAADASRLLVEAMRQGGDKAELVLYPMGREGEASARQVLKNRLDLQFTDETRAAQLLKAQDLRVVARPEYAPDHWIVEPMKGGAEATLRALSALTGQEGVRRIMPLLARHRQKMLLPNDSFFSQQWNLRNTGQGNGLQGVDANVTQVWDNHRGAGQRIGIVDDGLDLLHPDLSPSIDSSLGFDWNDLSKDADPTARPNTDKAVEDSHGTAVAGIAAARGGNAIGISGVAPEALLVGLRLISDQDSDGITDQDEAEAMSHRKDIIQVKNNSWGSGAKANALIGPGPLMRAALKDAAETGRFGRGTLFVWAAGNGTLAGEQGQKDGYTNSIYSTTVGAMGNGGYVSDYSEGGSHLVVVAPSSGGSRGIYTTDLRGNNGLNRPGSTGEPADRNYTNSFGGTSGATPVVSGVMALMLNANPLLNWRDVKEILLRSSRHVFPTTAGWVTRHGGDPSLPPVKHHESFGGGLVDAAAAVSMASTWTPLGPMLEETRSVTTAQAIPDNNETGINISFDLGGIAPMRVEHATLKLKATHTFRGDLDIRLISPGGVISNLAVKTVSDASLEGYNDWLFSSVRQWGESAAGVWTLSIRDLADRDTGTFQSAELKLYGTDAALPVLTSSTSGPFFLRVGDPLSLEGSGTGGGKVAFIWNRDDERLPGSSTTLNLPAVQVSDGGEYRLDVVNAAGVDSSETIQVGVVGPLPATMVVNHTLTPDLVLQAPAKGPGLSYQWKRNGEGLSNGGRITGADGPTLRITDASPADNGGYSCVVGMTGFAEPIESSAVMVTVLVPPVMNPPAFDNGVQGGPVNAAFSAQNSATSYKLRGKLPAGVKLDAATGQLSGRPTKPGTYSFFMSAVNAAGTSPEIEVIWQIESFPKDAVGTWHGRVEHGLDLNDDLGGSLKITVGATGSYSGRLTLGTRTFTWTGLIDALPREQSPTTPISIPQGKVPAAITGSFSLDLDNGLLSGNCRNTLPGSSRSLTGSKLPWSSTLKPVSASAAFNTAVFIPTGALEKDDPDYPQGSGWAVLTLSPSGSVSWAGKLAEGTSITGSIPMGPEGQVSIHQLLYSGTGSLQGLVTLNANTGLADGSLKWIKKPASANGVRSYKDGIPLHSLNARGALYTRPAKDTMLLGLQPPDSTQDQNARMLFTGTSIIGLTFGQAFQVTASGTARIPTGTTLNPQALTLSLTASNGRLNGSFTFNDANPFSLTAPPANIRRTAAFSGLIVTRSGLNQGIGFFTQPAMPENAEEKSGSTPVLSGRAELLPP